MSLWFLGSGGGKADEIPREEEVCNEIRCKQKNSYRSRTCSLPSLQNDGWMNIFMGCGLGRSPFFVWGGIWGSK